MSMADHGAGPGSDAGTIAADFARLIELIPAPATVMRRDGGSAMVNENYCRLFGLSRDEIAARALEDACHPDDLPQALKALAMAPGDEIASVDLRVRHKRGHFVLASFLAMVEPHTGWVVCVATDVTSRQRRQEELLKAARTDPLTGLANRSGLSHVLAEVLAQAADSPDSASGPPLIAAVDLDRFKVINDTFGHAVGDEVLRVVSSRLRDALPSDSAISRVGGDEFVVILPSSRALAADAVGPLIAERLREPMALGERVVSVDVSVGVAQWRPGLSAEELLTYADFAVYRAKADRKINWTMADGELIRARTEVVMLEHELRTALGTGAFVPWFQPVVDTVSEAVIGYESLIRWVRPSGEVVPAGDFIGVASDAGLLAAISSEVRALAFEAASTWPATTRLGLNLSAPELLDESLCDELIGYCDVFGIERNGVVIEVTEDTLIPDLELATQRLKRLADEGFHLALDDFGAGYSSLSYLTNLPIETVKLDRSFLARCRSDPAAVQNFEAVVFFVQMLGHDLVVEGVETAAEQALIASLAVMEAQGWYYGRAVPHEALKVPPGRQRILPSAADN